MRKFLFPIGYFVQNTRNIRCFDRCDHTTILVALFFAAVFAAVLTACSSDDKVAGISTVETENALLIQVVDSEGLPAANVTATIRSARYLPPSSEFADSIGATAAEYVTDEQGQIALSDSAISALDADTIAVEVLDDGVGAFAVIDLRRLRDVASDAANRDTAAVVDMSLEKLGSMESCFEWNWNEDVQVQIYGTGRTALADSNGCVKFEGLPPFEYEIRVTVKDSVVEVTCKVSAGEKASLKKDEFPWLLYLLPVDPESESKVISADSLISPWMEKSMAAREKGETVMGFIRLDSTNFDFSQVSAGGAAGDVKIGVASSAGDPLGYAVSYWNDSLKKAVILVPLAAEMESVKLLWADAAAEAAAKQISVADAWERVDSQVFLEQNSILAVDFESGMKSKLFKPADEPDWIFGFIGDSASIVTTPVVGNALEGIEEAGAGRDGYAFHWKSSAPNGKWSFVGLWLCRMEEACNLQALDSIAFYARGEGSIAFVLESTGYPNVEGKALSHETLSTDQWQRITATPSDFIEGDGKYGNLGYDAIINAITDFHIVAYDEAEVWLDDIRLYGINMDDLEQKLLRQ